MREEDDSALYYEAGLSADEAPDGHEVPTERRHDAETGKMKPCDLVPGGFYCAIPQYFQ